MNFTANANQASKFPWYKHVSQHNPMKSFFPHPTPSSFFWATKPLRSVKLQKLRVSYPIPRRLPDLFFPKTAIKIVYCRCATDFFLSSLLPSPNSDTHQVTLAWAHYPPVLTYNFLVPPCGRAPVDNLFTSLGLTLVLPLTIFQQVAFVQPNKEFVFASPKLPVALIMMLAIFSKRSIQPESCPPHGR